MLKINIFLSLLVLSQLEFSTKALSIDPCAHLKCPGNQAGCLELTHDTYECRCSSGCKRLSVINGPVVGTVAPAASASPIILTENGPVNESVKIPIARQGGSSCYPSACMNGGTCYSSYVPSTTTTTTTTTSSYRPPLCSCQQQFYGSRCELYNPATPADGWNNLCRVYNDRNMNICQNGGQCVFISDGKVACVCPSSFTGIYCELPVYVQCQNGVCAQCHRDYGTCQADGSCSCASGYSGPKCDQKAPYTVATHRSIYVTSAQTCLSYYCLNGGTCQNTNVDPYVFCLCPPAYTGTRCNIFLGQTNGPVTNNNMYNNPTNPPVYPTNPTYPTNPPAYPTNPPVYPTNPTYPTNPYYPTNPPITNNNPYANGQNNLPTAVPRCNFTIGLQNDGLYTSRFKVQYNVDGIQQPIFVSPSLPFVGQSTTVTIPYYAKNIVVSLEKLGFNWAGIVQDSNIDTSTHCTKCYKTWGAVTDAKWDYVPC